MAELLYQQLADHYLGLLRSGALRDGDRFPSVRQLMRTHQVSMSTATQATWWRARDRATTCRPRRARG
ncbi:GntR family transcriptional regulator [Ottowia oryzae]|uniref:GntR family transcriptional regulator n=1 Tax=Ottowia oryzae TaxID=2109914 RepID=UPI001FE8B6E4|nr:GntR family transcriptional regulator [Ottowia oryzae]